MAAEASQVEPICISVSGIENDGRKATSVVLANGEKIETETIIYSGDYKSLVGKILEKELFKKRFVKRIREARLTEAILTVYLGLDPTDDQLAGHLGAHHPFYFCNYDVIFPERSSARDVHGKMWVALNHFGVRSPSAPEGKLTLTLQTYSSYDWERFWRNETDDDKRTSEYTAFKHEVAMELVELAETLVPNLRDHIEYMDVGTPLSLKRFALNSGGSTGGWCYHDKVSPVFRLPTLNLFRTPLSNVYANGHYALWPGGVISAALSGRLVANLATGRRILTPMGKG